MVEIIIVFLLGWIIFSLSQHSRDGFSFQKYDEDDSMILAKQNEGNLSTLKKQLDPLNTLNEQVKNLQQLAESNQKQISTLTNQLHEKLKKS